MLRFEIKLTLKEVIVLKKTMARRKINEENIRNIQKSKRSYYITLPIEFLRSLGRSEKNKVSVKRMNDKLSIEKTD